MTMRQKDNIVKLFLVVFALFNFFKKKLLKLHVFFKYIKKEKCKKDLGSKEFRGQRRISTFSYAHIGIKTKFEKNEQSTPKEKKSNPCRYHLCGPDQLITPLYLRQIIMEVILFIGTILFCTYLLYKAL